MDIKVEIDAEQINKTITEAIIKSAIGKELERIINEQITSLSRRFDNPIERVVKGCVHDLLREMVMKDYRPQIEAHVRAQVTDQMVTELVEKSWKAFTNML